MWPRSATASLSVACSGEVASLLDAASSGSCWVSLVPVGGSGAPGTVRVYVRRSVCGPVVQPAGLVNRLDDLLAIICV